MSQALMNWIAVGLLFVGMLCVLLANRDRLSKAVAKRLRLAATAVLTAAAAFLVIVAFGA